MLENHSKSIFIKVNVTWVPLLKVPSTSNQIVPLPTMSNNQDSASSQVYNASQFIGSWHILHNLIYVNSTGWTLFNNDDVKLCIVQSALEKQSTLKNTVSWFCLFVCFIVWGGGGGGGWCWCIVPWTYCNPVMLYGSLHFIRNCYISPWSFFLFCHHGFRQISTDYMIGGHFYSLQISANLSNSR